LSEETPKCAVQNLLRAVEEFVEGPMCGKCHPCTLGSSHAAARLRRITQGEATDLDLAILRSISERLTVGSMCKKGKDIGELIGRTLTENREEFLEHINQRCRHSECLALMVYRVVPEKCTMCGVCLDVCRFEAIIGEKRVGYRTGYLPFEIRDVRCTRCGECLPACPEGAIEVVSLAEAQLIKVEG